MLPSRLCKKLAHLGTKQEEEEHSVSESIGVKNTKEIIELIVIILIETCNFKLLLLTMRLKKKRELIWL